MADQESKGNPQALEQTVRVSPEDFKALTPQTLGELREKYGVEIHIRTPKAGLKDILEQLDISGEALAAAEYDRGFDRTSPGYDKYYDRDRSAEIEMLTSTPAIDLEAMRRKVLEEARANLSMDDIKLLERIRGSE